MEVRRGFKVGWVVVRFVFYRIFLVVGCRAGEMECGGEFNFGYEVVVVV